MTSSDLYQSALAHVDPADVDTFNAAWERRSALMLDSVGVPPDLIAEICPARPGWGTLIYLLGDMARGKRTDNGEQGIDDGK